MVGYNVGSSGGSSGGNNHRDDTAKPDMVLEGYTFHAGENEEQQVGRIKNYSGTIDGTGNADETIFLSSKDRYIPAGVYMSESVKIEKVVTQDKSATPKNTPQTIKPDAGKFLSSVFIEAMAEKNLSFYRTSKSFGGSSGTNTLTVSGLSFKPFAVFWFLESWWDSHEDGGIMSSGFAIRKDDWSTSGRAEGCGTYLSFYEGDGDDCGVHGHEEMYAGSATLTWTDPDASSGASGSVTIKMAFEFIEEGEPDGIGGNKCFYGEFDYDIVVVGMK